MGWSAIERELLQRGVVFEETKFSEDVKTVEGVARELSIDEAQVAKAMLVLVDHLVIVAVVPGDRRLDVGAVKRLLSGRRARLARPKEVSKLLGVPVGAVTPLLSLITPRIQVLVDEGLLGYDAINVSSGDLQIGLNIEPDDLVEACSASVAGIATES